MLLPFGRVDRFGGGLLDEELLGVHLVLREVLDVHRAEVSQPDVQRHERLVDALDLHALHQVFREVHAGRRGSHGALLLGEDGLVTLGVLGFDLLAYPLRQRRFAQREERMLELLVGAVEQEAQRAPARGRIVDHLGHQQVVIAEVEFVADADLAGRVDQHVPEPQFAVQFAQQENLDLGTRLLLVAVEACWEDFGVVEYEEVFFVEVFDDVFENTVFDSAFGAVDDHQARIVPVFRRVFRQHFGGEIIPVLR